MPHCAEIFYRQYKTIDNRYQYPVILIHGAGSDLLGWPVQMRRLSNQHMIAIDLPGHGQSEGPVHHSLTALSDHLHRFILEMGFAHVVLAGYSLGGLIALEYASSHPKAVKGLSLVACGSQFCLPEGLLERLGHPREKEIVKDQLNQIFFSKDYPYSMRQKIMKPFFECSPGILKADFKIGLEYQPAGNMDAIQCPVQIISGSDDQVAPPYAVRKLSYMLSNTDVHFIPAAGHMVLFEKTEQVITLLRAFFQEVAFPKL
jgi:pimeloyl-ACP methyl ester carboxylesterase